MRLYFLSGAVWWPPPVVDLVLFRRARVYRRRQRTRYRVEHEVYERTSHELHELRRRRLAEPQRKEPVREHEQEYRRHSGDEKRHQRGFPRQTRELPAGTVRPRFEDGRAEGLLETRAKRIEHAPRPDCYFP